MKKKLTALLLCLCLCVGFFTACGGDGGGAQKLQQLWNRTEPASDGEEADDGEEPVQSLEQTPEAEASELTQKPEVSGRSLLPEVELVRTHRYEGDENGARYVSLLEAHYDVAQLSAESAGLYPQLAAALADYAYSFQRNKDAGLEEELSWAREQYGWMPDSFYAYTDESSLTVRRADTQAVSLLYLHSSYTGGIHPNYFYATLNYDTATGREIALEDVISDFDGLKTEMEKRLRDAYGEDTFFGLHEQLQEYGSDQFTWTMEPEGLRFYFSPYEMASYAAGTQQVFFGFDEAPAFFSGTYGKQEGDWAMAFSVWEDLTFHQGPGGSGDTLRVETLSDKDFGISGLKIVYNGQSLMEEELWAYDFAPVLLHSEAFGDFLYIDCSFDNDHHMLLVYRLGEDGPALAGRMSETGFYQSWQETGQTVSRAVTDPGALLLGRHTNLMSTYDVAMRCHLSESGKPESERDWFDIPAGHVLTALREMEFPLIDAGSGQETGRRGVIPIGAQVTMARTDCESFVDLAWEGALYRAYITMGEYGWPEYIDGIELEECFDGTMFAG